MDTQALASLYASYPDEDLTQVVSRDYDLAQAILEQNPDMAQDAGFALFDKTWSKRYWVHLVLQVKKLKTLDAAYAWAIGASIEPFANEIMAHYGLPHGSVPAAIALATIVLRAATASLGKEPRT
jgi:hypothetical protein